MEGLTMNFSMLERRTDPRTRAYVPILLRYEGAEQDTPAHMLDLSNGGACLLTTAYHAPTLGQYMHVKFETPTTDGGTEGRAREELAIAVNIRKHEREAMRIGVRFLNGIDSGSSFFSPKDVLGDHRKSRKKMDGLQSDRWSILNEKPTRGARRETVGSC